MAPEHADPDETKGPNPAVPEITIYTDEETEYGRAYNHNPPYCKPEKPAWIASRNVSGFDLRMDAGDAVSKRESRPIHRNHSCFDIKVEPNAKVDGVSQYMRDFAIYSKRPVTQPRTNIGKVRRPGTFPERTTSLERVKKTFDDDENANPVLKYFINLIARK